MMPFFIFILFSVVAVIAVASKLQAMRLSGAFNGIFSFRRNVLGFEDGIIKADGRQVQLYYHSGSKNNPSRLELSLIGDFCAQAVFRKETGLDRFGKEIGLNQEAQVYDPNFDSEVYVECEDQDFVRQCLGSSALKQRLKELLNEFSQIEIAGSKCRLFKTPCADTSRFTPDYLMDAAIFLAAFADGIPRPQPGQATATPLTDECRKSSGFLAAPGIIALIAGFALIVWGFAGFTPLEAGQIFLLALKIGAVLFILFMMYVYDQVKGLSNALTLLAGAFFSALVGIPLLLWGGLMVVNGSQDVSSPSRHETSVIGKSTSHSKNSTSYHIQVMPWLPGQDAYAYTVSSLEYGRINYGDPCEVTTREGLFRFTWVSARRCGR
jgi:hypothetical protein